MLKMDGFDDCIVGVVDRYGQEPIFCYSGRMVIERLMSQGMSEEEALEYFEFNQLGAWLGNETPCFIWERRRLETMKNSAKKLFRVHDARRSEVRIVRASSRREAALYATAHISVRAAQKEDLVEALSNQLPIVDADLSGGGDDAIDAEDL